MRMSEKRQMAAYNAIAEPITNLRVDILQGRTQGDIDDDLFRLESEIWRRIEIALNINQGESS